MAALSALRFFRTQQVAETQENSPRPSLLSRALAVGKSLKSMKPSDVAWMGGNMVVGAAAAKLGAAGVTLAASALGVTALSGAASVIAVGAVSAVAAGALSGTARALLQHIREQRQIERTEKRSFFAALKEETSALYNSKQFREKVIKSTKFSLLGAGLFGGFHAADSWFENSETGQAIATRVKDTFNDVAQKGLVSFDAFRKNLHAYLPLSTARATQLVTTPVVETLPHPAPTAVEIPTSAAAPVVSPDVAPQVAKVTPITPSHTKAFVERVDAEIASSANPSKAVSLGDQDVAERALEKAGQVVKQAELTNQYTLERLRNLIKETTGVDAPEAATAEDLAKQFHPSNPDAFLKGIEQQAPQLKVGNVAAACETQIPKEKGAVNVIRTICHKFKDSMGGDDIVTLNDTNQPDAQKGLRVFYRRAVQAIGGVVSRQDTTDFLMDNVTGPNGGVQEMTEQAFETAENAKLAGVSPAL